MHTVFILCSDPRRALEHRRELEAKGELSVVGITSQQRRARSMVAACDPDLVVADLRTEDGLLLELLRGLRVGGRVRRPLVLAVATDADDPLLLQTLRAGADAYFVDGPAPRPSLAVRVQQMLRGGAEMAPSIARHLLRHFDPAPAGGTAADPLGRLLDPLQPTPAERLLLRWLAAGLSIADIAVQEQMSLHAVRMRIRGVYRKLQWDLRAGALSLQAA